MTSVLLWLATAPSRARLKVLTWRWKWRLSNNLSLISQALCYRHRAQELSECRGGRLGLPVPNSPMLSVNVKQHLSCSISELRSCVKVEVDVLGSPSLNSPYGRCGRQTTLKNRAQELCESRGGRPRSPYGLCGFKATLTWTWSALCVFRSHIVRCSVSQQCLSFLCAVLFLFAQCALIVMP